MVPSRAMWNRTGKEGLPSRTRARSDEEMM